MVPGNHCLIVEMKSKGRRNSRGGGSALRASLAVMGVAFSCPLLVTCDGNKKEANSDKAVEEHSGATASGPPPWASRRTRNSGFPCDVEEVLAQSCRRCHWEPQENDAPFAMLRYENILAMRSGKPIHVLMEQMVQSDLMPPLDALVSPNVTPLEPEQKATLLKWLSAGAPESTADCL